MSLEGISSKGSLRFDEFPTSMKATQSFSGSRATRLLAYENARPSESRCSPFLRDEHARTPPPAFPFLQITMSKSRWACSGEPHSRTPDGSKSPIWSQRQSKRPSRRPEQAPPLSERITRSRLVPQVLRATRAKCVDKCRRFRCQEARPTNPGGPLPRRFLGDRDRQATFLPECASTLYPLTAR